MPRKGDRKVRTGCLTCKVRKVKCDEAKPSCNRCTSTGRNCDGYAQEKPARWMETALTRSSPSATSYQGGLARHLEYYHYVAGPGVAGQYAEDFWIKILPQVGERESAVRHALMAISMMYENSDTSKDRVAEQYNLAIRETLSSSNERVTLIMAILFTCLEFMNGDPAVAMSHSQHAILIANRSMSKTGPAEEALLSILARLSVFPFFFGGDHETFPTLRSLEGGSEGSPFPGVEEAHPALEILVAQTTRFMRKTGKYRLGDKRHSRIPHNLFFEQHRISLALDTWRRGFDIFEHSDLGRQISLRHMSLLKMIHSVAKIWISTTLCRDECSYDKHNDRFAAIITSAQAVKAEFEQVPYQFVQPKFSFDMGFLPLLYFVVLKCRILDLRLAALDCMKVLGLEQEALWRLDTLTSVGSRLIELEHGIDLSSDPSLWPDAVPTEEQRIRECELNQEKEEIMCTRWMAPDDLYFETVSIVPQ